MMTWLIENWMVVFGLAVAVIIAVLVVYRFFGLPTEKQREKVKEWLILQRYAQQKQKLLKT